MTLLADANLIRQVLPADEAAAAALRKVTTFYASFDEGVRGDFGHGVLEPSTRFSDEKQKGQFVFEKGIDGRSFHIAKDKGVQGGALEALDVLPRNGRVYLKALGNLAYQKGGWDGAVSVWCQTDPNRSIHGGRVCPRAVRYVGRCARSAQQGDSSAYPTNSVGNRAAWERGRVGLLHTELLSRSEPDWCVARLTLGSVHATKNT